MDVTFVEFYLEPLRAVAFLGAWAMAMLTTLVLGLVQR